MTRRDRIKALGELARRLGEGLGWRLVDPEMPIKRSEISDCFMATWCRYTVKGTPIYVGYRWDSRSLGHGLGDRDTGLLLELWARDIVTTLRNANQQYSYLLNGKAPEPKKDAEALLPEWGEECL